MRISTHILDTALGRPAAGVLVSLSRLEADGWAMVASERTDADGRCGNLLHDHAGANASAFSPGVYRLRFETDAYYRGIAVVGLYPFVEIAFEVVRGQLHYHIPLLLTANGYTTYRGS